ncbi:MAG: ABC transporter permease subunit [Spirochaetes bacterium]|jgi:putative chitobiose transport system permease protein|nr:ABC transporter permease subunit [Spirochaetota bacterium]
MTKRRSITHKTVQYLLLLLVLSLSITPFIWILSTALKSPSENIFAFPPKIFPETPTLSNFVKVFQTIPLLVYFKNSLLVVAATVTFNVLFALMAAFPLAKMDFPGKKIIFVATLSTLMIPVQLTMIPNFILIVDVGLKNNLWGVILPNMVTAFGIFLIRQALITVPSSMEEAALMDGASSARVLFQILLPMVKPAAAALAIFTFVNMWGDFLWPLLVLEDADLLTVPLGVQKLQGTFTNDWRLIASGAVLAMIPVLTFFLINQRHFIEGAISSGVKG